MIFFFIEQIFTVSFYSTFSWQYWIFIKINYIFFSVYIYLIISLFKIIIIMKCIMIISRNFNKIYTKYTSLSYLIISYNYLYYIPKIL